MELSAALRAVTAGAGEVEQRMPALADALGHYRGPVADDGVSLLRAKSATLLRYTGNLVRFAEHRVRGAPPPPALRALLVEDWAALEKMRPLEKRLRPQLDTLLAAARTAEPAHRPDPAAMLEPSDSEGDEPLPPGGAREEGDPALAPYAPPRIAETVFPDDRAADAQKKARDDARRERMRRGAGARAMLAEVSGAPVIIEDPTRRAAADDERKMEFEERNFVRVARTRKERISRERKERAAAGEPVRGQDELSGLIGFADRIVKKPGPKQKRAGVDDEEVDREAKVRALDRLYGDDLEETRQKRKEKKRRRAGGSAGGQKKQR